MTGVSPEENGSNGSNGNLSKNGQIANNKPTETVKVGARLERAVDPVDKLLAAGNNVTLDFSECGFVTVDGLEWLEEILLRSESLKTNILFINLNPKLYKVFKVAHIDSLQKACGAPGPAVGPAC